MPSEREMRRVRRQLRRKYETEEQQLLRFLKRAYGAALLIVAALAGFWLGSEYASLWLR